MIIDVSSILKEFGGRLEIDGEVAIEPFEFGGEEFTLEAPVKVKGTIVNNGKSLQLTADVETVLGTQCGRCLADIDVDTEFSLDEHFVRTEDGTPTDDEVIAFDGHTIELDNVVFDNLLMNIDGKYLCADDCKGLCPECGCDLNEGECECNKEFIDPRWAGLADLMKND